MKKRSILAASLCSLLLPLVNIVASSSHAQQPGVFEVLMSASDLAARTGTGATLGEGLGPITAFADGAECVSADVSSASADVVLQLGLAGQPSACSRDGATVTFREGRGYLLVSEFPLVKGTRVALINFAPYPPGAEPTATPSAQSTEPPPKLPMDCRPVLQTIDGGPFKSFGFAEVTLPPGTYVRLLIPPETIYFGFCHVETGAQVTLSVFDCTEGSRYAPSAAAEAIVDQIVASCRISQAPSEPLLRMTADHVIGGIEYEVPGEVRLNLPAGMFTVTRDPLKPRTVTICSLQDNGVSMRYEVLLSLNDCSQLAKAVVDGVDPSAGDEIAVSCEVIRDESGGPPASTARPTSRGITPPDTGSGGLLDRR